SLSTRGTPSAQRWRLLRSTRRYFIVVCVAVCPRASEITGNGIPLESNRVARVCRIAWGPNFLFPISTFEALMIRLMAPLMIIRLIGRYGAHADKNTFGSDDTGRTCCR